MEGGIDRMLYCDSSVVCPPPASLRTHPPIPILTDIPPPNTNKLRHQVNVRAILEGMMDRLASFAESNPDAIPADLKCVALLGNARWMMDGVRRGVDGWMAHHSL